MYSLKLRKVSEEYKGMPWSWTIPCAIYGVVTILFPAMLLILFKSLLIKLVMVMVCIAAGYGFYTKMRTPTILKTTMLEVKYIMRVRKGEHIIPKHIVPLQFLKQIVPLEVAHPNGLIEFTNKRFGIMYQVFVPRRTGDELNIFINMVTKNIIDRIHDGQVLKVFKMQRYTTDTSIKNQVASAMNDESKTLEQREHLNSIYAKLVSNVEIPTKPFIYVVVILGRFETVDEARAERDNLVPSLEDGFKLGGIGFNMLINPGSIGLAYRRCIK